MKARPILFSAPMVRAILDGTKTQTRRVVKDVSWPFDRPQMTAPSQATFLWMDHANPYDRAEDRICSYGQPGDRLWVREAIKKGPLFIDDDHEMFNVQHSLFEADDSFTKADTWRWKRDRLPGMFLPRGLSRITLEIVNVRVERLNDISEEDARAEGVERDASGWKPSTHAFMHLWESINGAGSWDANPWVWCLEFKRI